MDPDIESKQQLHRRIHFYVIEDVEMELKRLKELDIIEIVTGLTPCMGEPYCHSPQELWKESIWVDMREANKAVKREKHQMLTIDDLAADLNGATFFI